MTVEWHGHRATKGQEFPRVTTHTTHVGDDRMISTVDTRKLDRLLTQELG